MAALPRRSLSVLCQRSSAGQRFSTTLKLHRGTSKRVRLPGTMTRQGANVRCACIRARVQAGCWDAERSKRRGIGEDPLAQLKPARSCSRHLRHAVGVGEEFLHLRDLQGVADALVHAGQRYRMAFLLMANVSSDQGTYTGGVNVRDARKV